MFFLSISPFQLCTILWNNVPRIFLSLVVRETTSRYRFRLRFDPTPLCFPCKILPRISYPGLYQSLLLSFLFFYPNLPHDLTYTFPLKILGDRDDTFRFPLFLIQVYIQADFGSSFYRTTNARGNDRASRSQFISRVKLIFNATSGDNIGPSSHDNSVWIFYRWISGKKRYLL